MADTTADKVAQPDRKIDVEALLKAFKENLGDYKAKDLKRDPELGALAKALGKDRGDLAVRRRALDPFPFRDISGSMGGSPYETLAHAALDERYFDKKIPPEMLAHESAHRHDFKKIKHKPLAFDDADIANVIGLQKWMFGDIPLTEEERLQQSCQNGTTLAEAFQSGTSTPTQTMKPITLRRGFAGVSP